MCTLLTGLSGKEGTYVKGLFFITKKFKMSKMSNFKKVDMIG